MDGAGRETFGALVRRYRQAAALSQEGLAARAGLSVDAVSVIERGKRGAPRPDTVALLVQALDLAGAARAAFIAAAQPPRAATGRVAARHPGPGGAASVAAGALTLPPVPVPPTTFIGRTDEIAAVRARLLDPHTRLLTLTGPGGAGKTRLALEVARAVGDAFPAGACVVDLAPLTDPALVLPTIAHALGLAEAGSQPVRALLHAYLRTRQPLLVLDNFEQVLEAARVVSDVLATCAGVRVLVTSRAALHLRGERLYSVPPLALPDLSSLPLLETLRQYEAMRLFVDRAQDVTPAWRSTPACAAASCWACAGKTSTSRPAPCVWCRPCPPSMGAPIRSNGPKAAPAGPSTWIWKRWRCSWSIGTGNANARPPSRIGRRTISCSAAPRANRSGRMTCGWPSPGWPSAPKCRT